MRPMARGLVQHGGRPGWLEESNPAGVILYVMDGPYRLPFPYRTGCPARSCPSAADGISSCCYTVNVQTNIRHELPHARKAWPGILVDPCLLSGYSSLQRSCAPFAVCVQGDEKRTAGHGPRAMYSSGARIAWTLYAFFQDILPSGHSHPLRCQYAGELSCT